MPNKRKRSTGPIVPAPPPPAKAPPAKRATPAASAPASEPPPPPVLPDADELLLAEDRCWDDMHDAASSALGQPKAAAGQSEALSLELARAQAIRRLRLRLGEDMRSLQLTTPATGAFERWHFGWLAAAGDGSDPLLPAVPAPTTDAALADELVKAGADAERAAAAAASLRQAAQLEAAKMARARSEAACVEAAEAIELRHAPNHSSSSASRSGGVLWHLVAAPSEGTPPLKVSDEQLTKLRALHGQATAGADEATFRHDLARLLLRYKTVGGSGFHASLGGGTAT